jgi:acetyltransferase-like isoleucine patch superfamily enzyme
MRDKLVLAHDWWPERLPPNVAIGEGSWLYSSFAFLHYRSERPCGLRVGQNSGLYKDTLFDLGPEGEVRIGDYCTIAGVIISSNGRVLIGDYALVSYNVIMADSFAAVPEARTETPEGQLRTAAAPGSIVIGDNVWIGAQATVLAGARIGEGAIIGAGSVVDFEVPPYAIVVGNPARVVGWARPKERPA